MNMIKYTSCGVFWEFGVRDAFMVDGENRASLKVVSIKVEQFRLWITERRPFLTTLTPLGRCSSLCPEACQAAASVRGLLTYLTLTGTYRGF